MVRVVSFDIGIINMSYCVAEISACGEAPSIVACRVFRIGDMKDTLAVLIHNMVKILHTTPEVNDQIEDVLIEQQIATRASRNTSLAAAVFAYYEQLRARGHANLNKIAFVNPRSKFKVLYNSDIPCIEPFKTEIKEARGPALKKLAIKMATLLAEHWECHVFLDALRAAKKKDDMSDVFMYATLCS